MFLLDTNAVIALMKGNPGMHERARSHHPRDVALSSIVMHEFYYGAYRGRRVESNLARVDDLLLEMLPFDGEDARRAGEIRATLAAADTPIGPYDVLIAGQALSRRLVLVTRNRGEFERVDGLRIEDWEST